MSREGEARTSLLGLLVAVSVAALVLGSARAPRVVASSVGPEAFSGERALRHVERLAESPRPLGSPAHAAARAALSDELEGLGLEPEVQDERLVLRRSVDRFLVVRVQNVAARLPGRSSSGAILMAAHYDSRPQTPGAGDDMSGVATILETLRALSEGPQLDNDVIVLFSDAEELGLVGARAFVERHRWAEDVALVLNLEARGNRGPSAMFETRQGNLEAMRGFARAAPLPYASSMAYEVYRRMPNDSDFSVFREAGVQGFNMAFLGRLSAYHTMLDTAAALDADSLQHQGSYALGLVRHFGEMDLERLSDESSGDAVYFNPYPWRLVLYPAAWALPIALAASGLLMVGIGLCWRRRRIGWLDLLRGLRLFALTVGGGAAVGWCFWWLIRNYLPRLLFGPYGQPYDLAGLVLAIVLLVLALVGALTAWSTLGGRGVASWAGIWLGWAALAVALAIVAPGASFLGAWPLAGGAMGLIAIGLVPMARDLGHSEPLILAAATLPTVLLISPVVWAVAQALTLSAAGIIGAVTGLLATGLAPLLGHLHRASGSRFSVLLMLAGLALLAWTTAMAAPTSETPAANTLSYAVDNETGEAWWASFDEETDDWTGRFLGEVAERQYAPAAFALPDTPVLVAPADPVSLPAPVATLISDSRASGRNIEASVRSARGAAVLRIRAEASVPLESVTVEGERFDFAGDAEAEGIGEVWITAYGLGDGVRVGFHVSGAWPIELDLVDQSWSFDALPEPPGPRPERMIPTSSWRTDAVYVRGSSLL